MTMREIAWWLAMASEVAFLAVHFAWLRTRMMWRLALPGTLARAHYLALTRVTRWPGAQFCLVMAIGAVLTPPLLGFDVFTVVLNIVFAAIWVWAWPVDLKRLRDDIAEDDDEEDDQWRRKRRAMRRAVRARLSAAVPRPAVTAGTPA